MDDFQSQMNNILQDPQMMQKIMSMAQSLSGPQEVSAPSEPAPVTGGMPEIDLAMVQKLSGFLGQSNIDGNQRSLLKALTPYLDSTRIAKLEKAMRAAKLATLASSLLSNSGLQLGIGR